jgi:hypothetical protein
MLIPHWRKVLLCSCLFAALTALGTGLARVAAKSETEAPGGFNTPSFNGAQSVSNGIVEPPGDTFARDQEVYEQNHSVQTGLGPVYNATACVSCHENPNSGGASQFTELRVGHKDENGNFVNPTIFINDGKNTITGRSIVNDRAIGPEAQEHIPAAENIRALRAALNTLGDGFVEAIDDRTLIAIAERQPDLSEGRVHGEVVQAPIFEAPGQTRVGRFGWKDQHSSLLSFIGDAYLNEMGITNRLRPTDVTRFSRPQRTGKISQMTLAWLTSTILLSSYVARWFLLETRRLPQRPRPYEGENFSGGSAVVFAMWNPLRRLLQGLLSMAVCLSFQRPSGIRSSIPLVTFCCTTSEPAMGSSRLGRRTRPTNYDCATLGIAHQTPLHA